MLSRVKIAKRHLHLHEYQSLGVFSKFGVGVPRFEYAQSPQQVEESVNRIAPSGGKVVIKAQVLAGGRGLGHFKENGFKGGVKVCSSSKEASEVSKNMIGNTLITKQTGEAAEKYFAILMDRSFGGPVLVGSSKGGMSIEDVAHEFPELIVKMPIDINTGLSRDQAKEMADKIGFKGEEASKSAVDTIMGLYKTFIDCDCTMVEINPLSELTDGRVVVCDAKVNFDDNAAFRQAWIHAQRDRSQEDPREVEAAKFDLNYIGLDGSIGCMVNGAGLAMATMDLLKLFGGSPANFLDVGGSAQADQITAAFKILDQDPKVKSILVNIFGGIMRCDVVAEGIVQASQILGMKKPVVVRLVGTNVEKGKRIIADSGLKIYANDDLNAAAKKAVELAGTA